ncbi:MAG: hypothetical protein JNM93_12830 [Bacteriovoracaceae bacterium]|nr:hypothetical protein [Bacteriovoracaceae bacterium]
MVIIIDFNDSFTFNIAEVVYREVSQKLKVIPYSDIAQYQDEILSPERKVIILGPGPGKAQDYSEIYPYLKAWLKLDQIFLVGICLGHQMLWDILGYPTVNLAKPIHGVAFKLRLNQRWKRLLKAPVEQMMVQHYNSLMVQMPSEKTEISIANKQYFLGFNEGVFCMSSAKSFLTYQFHPESIGTTYPSVFFTPLKEFFV